MEYAGAVAAGVLFCMAVWFLFLQCRELFFYGTGEVLRDIDGVYVR